MTARELAHVSDLIHRDVMRKSAAEYAREARRMRREGLAGTREYREMLNDWQHEEFAAIRRESREGCLTCWSPKCDRCGHCHECEDHDMNPRIVRCEASDARA